MLKQELFVSQQQLQVVDNLLAPWSAFLYVLSVQVLELVQEHRALVRLAI